MQYEQDADGGVEGHQGPERGGPHVAQREHLEGIRKDREQQGQAACGGQDVGGEMSGGLRDARERRDGDSEREPLDAGEAVADLLGEQDVSGSADRGELG